MEKTPFTLNTHYLAASTEKWLAKYKDAKAGKGVKKNGWSEEWQPAKKQRQEREDVNKGPTNEGIPKKQMPKAPTKLRQDAYVATESSFSVFGELRNHLGLYKKRLFRHFDVGTGSNKFTWTRGELGFGTDTTLPTTPSVESLFAEKPAPFFKHPPTSSVTFAQPPSAFQQPFKPRQTPPDPEKVQAALAMLVEIGYSGITEDDLGRLNPTDEFETELLVMAQIRGYFQVAYKVCYSRLTRTTQLTNSSWFYRG